MLDLVLAADSSWLTCKINHYYDVFPVIIVPIEHAV